MFKLPTDTFLQWFNNSAPFLNPKIRIADLREANAGNGIVANADLKTEEEVFSVRRQNILCIDNTDIASLRSRNTEDFNPWNDLILTLIYEDLKGGASRWAPYLAILPDVDGANRLDTLMFWTEEELAELQGSAVRHKIGRKSADENFMSSVIPVIRKLDGPFASLPALEHCSDQDLLIKAHRMGSLIMAYAFDLEPETAKSRPDEDGYVSDEEDAMLPKGMIPMADLLNADAERNNARLYYDPDSVTMKTLTDVAAGQQLFNDYGPLPRSDLLRRYGYVTDNYRQYDVVEIDYSLVFTILNIDQSSVAHKMEWLEDHDLFDDAFDISWPLEDESFFPWQLRALLHVLNTDDKSAWKQLTKSDASEQPVPHPLSPDWAYKVYEQILMARLAMYDTSALEDRQILDTLGPQEHSRRKMAIQVRLGEKELLEAAIAKTRELRNTSSNTTSGLKRSKQDDDSDDDGARKRSK